MLHRVLSQTTAATLAVFVILTIAILSSNQVRAQVSGATLSGTITDPSGASIVGARVVIANKATGVSRDVTSDSAGYYLAPNLLPGNYEVTVSASGFSATRQPDLTLTV